MKALHFLSLLVVISISVSACGTRDYAKPEDQNQEQQTNNDESTNDSDSGTFSPRPMDVELPKVSASTSVVNEPRAGFLMNWLSQLPIVGGNLKDDLKDKSYQKGLWMFPISLGGIAGLFWHHGILKVRKQKKKKQSEKPSASEHSESATENSSTSSSSWSITPTSDGGVKYNGQIGGKAVHSSVEIDPAGNILLMANPNASPESQERDRAAAAASGPSHQTEKRAPSGPASSPASGHGAEAASDHSSSGGHGGHGSSSGGAASPLAESTRRVQETLGSHVKSTVIGAGVGLVCAFALSQLLGPDYTHLGVAAGTAVPVAASVRSWAAVGARTRFTENRLTGWAARRIPGANRVHDFSDSNWFTQNARNRGLPLLIGGGTFLGGSMWLFNYFQKDDQESADSGAGVDEDQMDQANAADSSVSE